MQSLPVDPFILNGLAALGGVLLVTSAIGFKLKGPVRWVRIVVALLLTDFLAMRCAYAGLASGLQTGAILVGTVFATVSFAFMSWRHPISKVLSPATRSDCPKHAAGAIRRWTEELEELGFEMSEERRTVWEIQGQERVTYIRFLTHHSEPLWVELHAIGDPKIAARMVVSDKGDGRAVLTCDRQPDQEFFDDALTVQQRLPEGSACVDLVDAHRKLAMTSEGRLSRVDDPARAHVEIYASWVQRLIATGQVRSVDGARIALIPRTIPRLVLKSWAAWFQ